MFNSPLSKVLFCAVKSIFCHLNPDPNLFADLVGSGYLTLPLQYLNIIVFFFNDVILNYPLDNCLPKTARVLDPVERGPRQDEVLPGGGDDRCGGGLSSAQRGCQAVSH